MGRVVVDTSVLINFCHLDRLDLLGAFLDRVFVIPREVEEEVLEPSQRTKVQRALTEGHLGRASTAEHPVLHHLTELRTRNLDLGEAACVALAKAHGWLVACDERRRFLRIAKETLGAGRVIDTPGLLLMAIQQDLLSLAQAERAKARLEAHRFRMRFRSFRDLIALEESDSK